MIADASGPAGTVGAESLQDGLERAYRYLTMRDRTVAEVRRHLTRHALAPELVEACVAELERQRYLDDERFAQRFAEDRRALDSWGSERIRERLVALGIEAECADRAAGPSGGAAELDAAVALLRRRLREAPGDERGRSRALGLLVRRGYELELAHDAIRRFECEPG